MIRSQLRYLATFSIAVLLLSCAHTHEKFQDLNAGRDDEAIVREGLAWLEQHPHDVETRISVGNAAWRLGRKDQAQKIWAADDERIVARDVYLGNLLIKLAMERGDLRDAERLLSVKPPETIPPDMGYARRQLLAKIRSDRIDAADAGQRGDGALLAGEYSRALDFYKRAAALDPTPEWNARLQAIQAWVLFHAQGQIAAEQVTQMLATALHLESSPPILFLAAAIQLQLGNREQFQAAREVLRDRFPHSPFTAQVERME